MFFSALERSESQLSGTCFSVLMCPVFISQFEYEFLIIDGGGEVPLII